MQNIPLSLSFFVPMALLRNVMSYDDKLKYSKEVPSWFDEIMCGVMLGDGNLRMNGRDALLSVQQTHEELTKNLWEICFKLNLVITPMKTLNRRAWKTIYYFQSPTPTLPYFTNLREVWYPVLNGRVKALPANIDTLLTPLALAHWIMGDGGFDGHGRGDGRVTLYTNNFTLEEVELLRSILLSKFNLESSLRKVGQTDPLRGYAIRIPSRCLGTLQSLVVPHMYPSLMYKLGL
jgi:hypothetical protein